ncbi:MAG TPA: CoA-binding protein [Ignavibacteriaceae bacterium]|nr:CoA-binding protein [Ignavibacteriaceae bacterium]
MNSKKLIEDFLSEENIAVVGVSRNNKKFGYIIYKDLKAKGYNVYPVNPNVANIDQDKCYPSLLSLSGKVEAAVLIVPPFACKEVVKNAYNAGIKKIWMQTGSGSEEAINYCNVNDIDVINNECILMFAEPTAFFHKAHRWINGIVGKLPE